MKIVLSLVALQYAALGHRVAVLVVGEDGEAGEGGGKAEQSEDRPRHPQGQLRFLQGSEGEEPLNLGLDCVNWIFFDIFSLYWPYRILCQLLT